MKDDIEKKLEETFFEYFFKTINDLPKDKCSLMESEIGIVLDWMNNGFTKKVEEINNALKKAKLKKDSEYLEYIESTVSDDYYMIETTKNTIYAAIIVIVWSSCERIFNAIKAKFTKTKEKNNFKIDEYKNFFKDRSIHMEGISGFQSIDLVRKLNNSYKHNNGILEKSKVEDESVLNKYNVELDSHGRIIYSEIKIEELIFESSKFLDLFLKEVKKKCSRK